MTEINASVEEKEAFVCKCMKEINECVALMKSFWPQTYESNKRMSKAYETIYH